MSNFENRKFVILLIFFTIGIIYIFRLFYIQVIDEKWAAKAESISRTKQHIVPARGLIYDRNEELMVENISVYNLMVDPRKIENLDTLYFCKLLNIDTTTFNKKMKKVWEKVRAGRSLPTSFEKDIPRNEFIDINDNLYKFKGFSKETSVLRIYPDSVASHILGYVGAITPKALESNPYYLRTDLLGRKGIEKAYEEELRGERGKHYFLKDKTSRKMESLMGGSLDTIAEAGKDIHLTIDIQLQKYAEALMQNKVGSIVAIEPSTGEILSMVSAPTYDPNEFVGRNLGKNYSKVVNDSLKPLNNRAIGSQYMPGSIFKMVQALVGLQEKVITPRTEIWCDGSLIGDHVTTGYYNVSDAIKFSSNMWFYQEVKRIIQKKVTGNIYKDSRLGLEVWGSYMHSFGFGNKLGIDIEGEVSGRIPDLAIYDKQHGVNRWSYSYIYSISIGQGEVELTPLQMANFGAIIANKGYYYPPHLVKKIGDDGRKKSIYLERKETKVSPDHFPLVIDAMEQVVTGGTGRNAYIEDIVVCGKTGTVQNPHGNDHSVFLAFAPKDKPKIAVAVYVENGTWGSTWAAPIAGLMIEKYIKGEISKRNKYKEKKMLEGVLLDPHAKF